jgi:hypothetical protein
MEYEAIVLKMLETLSTESRASQSEVPEFTRLPPARRTDPALDAALVTPGGVVIGVEIKRSLRRLSALVLMEIIFRFNKAQEAEPRTRKFLLICQDPPLSQHIWLLTRDVKDANVAVVSGSDDYARLKSAVTKALVEAGAEANRDSTLDPPSADMSNGA